MHGRVNSVFSGPMLSVLYIFMTTLSDASAKKPTKNRKGSGFQLSHFYLSFSSYIMAVKTETVYKSVHPDITLCGFAELKSFCVVRIQELSNAIGKGLYFLLFTADLLSCNGLHVIHVQSGGNVSCSFPSFVHRKMRTL